MRFSFRDDYKASLLSIIILIISYIPIGGSIYTGLDNSWVFALNWFFDQNLQVGTDIIYTYGPLGFLMVPVPIGNQLFLGAMIWMVFRYLLIFSLVSYLYNHKRRRSYIEWLVSLLLIYSVLTLTYEYTLLLVMLTFMCFILYQQTSKKIYLAIAISTIEFALLSKFGIGIMTFCILISYIIYEYFSEKRYSVLKVSILTMPISFVFFWILLYGNLDGIITYFISSINFSKGHISAMTVNPPVSWGSLILFALSFISIPIILRERYVYFLFSIISLALFSHWRYSYSRADGHILFFTSMVTAFYLIATLIIFTENRKKALIAFSLAMLGLVALFYNTTFMGTPSKVNNFISSKLGPKYFMQEIKYKSYRIMKIVESDGDLKKDKLPDPLLKIIQNSSIDIYPWELSIKAANNDLNWRQRPVIQSHMDFTPWLDKQNASFFYSDKAPDFILWHKTSNDLEGIDQRYLLNDDPDTIYAMFDKYNIAYKDNNYILLKRTQDNNFAVVKDSGINTVKWGEWINTPIVAEGYLLRAKIDVSRKIRGLIKRTLYKEENFFIDYMLDEGKIISKRIVIDNAPSGLWINPFLMNEALPEDRFKAYHVQKIRIRHSSNDFFTENINITWQTIQVLKNENYRY